MNFTLCKNRCNYTKRNKQSRNPPSPSNPLKTALSFEKHYILASLVKGEVLSPEKIRATTGGIAFYRTLSVSQTPPLTIPQSQ